MESWMMPFGALAAVTLIEVLVLAAILHRLGALYAMLDGALPASPHKTGLPVGASVPFFTGSDQDGTVRTSEEFRGQPYVMAFVHPGCRYCHAVLPLLHEASDQHAGRVRILLATSADSEAARRYASDHGIKLPLLTLGSDGPENLFGATATPFAFGIDRNGVIRAKGVIRAEPTNLDGFVAAAESPVDPDARTPVFAATAERA